MVQAVQRHFGDRLRFVLRDFPLTEMHPHAEHAAEAAEAAGAQGAFWPMHDRLFERQRSPGDADLAAYAEELGLNAARVAREVREDRYTDRIRRDFMGGVRSGVNGTPTFFMNGNRYDGCWELPDPIDALEGAPRGQR
jgi:protein-disulfide isomerase